MSLMSFILYITIKNWGSEGSLFSLKINNFLFLMNCIFLLLHATSTCSVLKNLHVLSLKLTGKEIVHFF